mmetsp:Transcript_112380/g.176872  ORF Transcript_112380/g.176872 Transcript_112380/m.176872 type:complete len:276 (-) Transcript_112380:522-1349(-)
MGSQTFLGNECCKHAYNPRFAFSCSNPCQDGSGYRQARPLTYLDGKHQQRDRLRMMWQHRHIVLFFHALRSTRSDVNNQIPVIVSESRHFTRTVLLRLQPGKLHSVELAFNIQIGEISNVSLHINERFSIKSLGVLQQSIHTMILSEGVRIFVGELLVSLRQIFHLHEAQKEYNCLQRIEQRHPSSWRRLEECTNNFAKSHLNWLISNSIASYSKPPSARCQPSHGESTGIRMHISSTICQEVLILLPQCRIQDLSHKSQASGISLASSADLIKA